MWGMLSAFALSPMLTSCGNNGCEETRESYLLVQFKSTSGLSLDQLSTYGIVQDDSIISILSSESEPSEVEFTLRPDTNYTQFLLNCIASELTDTTQYISMLHLWYSRQPYFLDMECGCSMQYMIDSARIEAVSSSSTDLQGQTKKLFRDCTIKNYHIINEENVNIILEY